MIKGIYLGRLLRFFFNISLASVSSPDMREGTYGGQKYDPSQALSKKYVF